MSAIHRLTEYAENGVFPINRDETEDFLREINRIKICAFEMVFYCEDVKIICNMIQKHELFNFTQEQKQLRVKCETEYRVFDDVFETALSLEQALATCKRKCLKECYCFKIENQIIPSMFWKFDGTFNSYTLSHCLLKNNRDTNMCFVSIIINNTIANIIFCEDENGNFNCVTGKTNSTVDYYYNMKWTLLVFMYEQHYNCLCNCLFERILSDEYLVKMILKY